MGHLNLDDAIDDLEAVLQTLFPSADDVRKFVTKAEPKVAGDIDFSTRNDAVFGMIEYCNAQGVLDRLLAAAARKFPFRGELRGLVVRFSVQPGWQAAASFKRAPAGDGLQSLTSAGNPFVSLSRLGPWLVRAERGVCQVRCGDASYGTGFLVAPDLVLTCYHVVERHLADNVDAKQVEVRFDYREAADGAAPNEQLPWLGIDATWKIPSSRYSKADITLDGEPAADELDYAFLKLAQPAGSEVPDGESAPRGWFDLSKPPPLPAADAPLMIAQHPENPNAPPPQLPLQLAFATPGFGSPNANQTRVAYKPSTRKGSSGSPVFGPDLRPTALHHNRGQIDPNAVDRTLDNRGIPLAKIVESLDPAVRALLVSTP